MSRYAIVLGVFLTALFCVSQAQATVIFSDNWYGYADQAAFQAAWPVVSPQPTGTLSTAQAVSAPNSISIPSSSATAVAPRNGRSFTETGIIVPGDQLIWSFDFYDEAPAAAPYRQYANLQDGTGPGTSPTGQLISIGMNNNQSAVNSGGQYYMARILGYTVPTTADPDGGPAESVGGAGAYFKLNDFTAPNRSLGWHNFKVIMTTDDGVDTDYAFYVDNVLNERVAAGGVAGSIRSYDVIRIGAGVSAPSGAWFDNMNVEYIAGVPEPSAFALMLLGGGMLLRRRRAA